jgi:hypothetical protein
MVLYKVIKKNNWSYVKTMSCSGSHLGITINIKNTTFVKDLPMIDLTLDPMGKMFQNASSLKPLGQLKPNCPGMIIGRSSVFYTDRKSKMAATTGHSNLGITINIKNTTFVKDLPMIDAQFRFNQCNSF